MRKDITLIAEPRETRGKNAARRLRVEKKSPAVLYGGEKGPVAVTVSPKEVGKILLSSSGSNTIFNLDVQGEVTPVMVVDWQTDPLKNSILHVDLKRIDLTAKIVVAVPVLTHGDPKGVKLQGGHYELVNRVIEIEVLPDDIPEHFDVTVTELMMGDSVRAKDIVLSGSMKLLSDPELVISHVVNLRGDDAVVDPAAAAEPEVAKKGKKEDPAAKAPAAKGAAPAKAAAKAAAPAKKK